MADNNIAVNQYINTNIANELALAQDKTQYDKYAKRVLSNIWILAWILKNTAPEFACIPLEQTVKCINNDILISRTHMHPGETNKIDGKPSTAMPERIIGDNTEDIVPDEGTIYYDIRFSAYAPGNNEPVKILLNIEAQKVFHIGYPLVTRGIFYAARMISAQLDTEFTTEDYSGLKKVYSIWICMNTPEYIGNAISKYHIGKTDIIEGIPDIPEAYDKMSVIMVCLNRDLQKSSGEKGLIGLLNTVFANDISVNEKKKILSEDYGIAMTHDIVKELGHMCNLSEGIWERGRADGLIEGWNNGRADGLATGIKKSILLLRSLGTADNIIANMIKTEYSISTEEVQAFMNADAV